MAEASSASARVGGAEVGGVIPASRPIILGCSVLAFGVEQMGFLGDAVRWYGFVHCRPVGLLRWKETSVGRFSPACWAPWYLSCPAYPVTPFCGVVFILGVVVLVLCVGWVDVLGRVECRCLIAECGLVRACECL